MRWFTDRLTTIREAVGVNRFAIGGVEAAVAVGLDWLARHWEGYPLRLTPKWFVWIFIAAFLVAWWLLNYANGLRKERLPKIALQTLQAQRTQDAINVRVLIENTSDQTVSDLVAYIDDITDDNEAFKASERMLFEYDTHEPTDFPIQITTKERQADILAGKLNVVLPFKLRPHHPKQLEVFQIRPTVGGRMHVFRKDKIVQFITADDMTFKCRVLGTESPLAFDVEYRILDEPGYEGPHRFRITLFDADGKATETQEYQLD